jgi:hypothetical protein
VILYQILTGRLPYDIKDSFTQAVSTIVNQIPTPPSKLLLAMRKSGQSVKTGEAHVDPALDVIVLKALAKRPQDRYSSAGELALAVGAFLAAAKARSRRWHIVAGAAVIAVVAAGVAFSIALRIVKPDGHSAPGPAPSPTRPAVTAIDDVTNPFCPDPLHPDTLIGDASPGFSGASIWPIFGYPQVPVFVRVLGNEIILGGGDSPRFVEFVTAQPRTVVGFEIRFRATVQFAAHAANCSLYAQTDPAAPGFQTLVASSPVVYDHDTAVVRAIAPQRVVSDRFRLEITVAQPQAYLGIESFAGITSKAPDPMIAGFPAVGHFPWDREVFPAIAHDDAFEHAIIHSASVTRFGLSNVVVGAIFGEEGNNQEAGACTFGNNQDLSYVEFEPRQGGTLIDGFRLILRRDRDNTHAATHYRLAGADDYPARAGDRPAHFDTLIGEGSVTYSGLVADIVVHKPLKAPRYFRLELTPNRGGADRTGPRVIELDALTPVK